MFKGWCADFDHRGLHWWGIRVEAGREGSEHAGQGICIDVL